MHDLIQEMGWDIVRRESIKNPGERSRLWNHEEVYDVLKNNKGTDRVEAVTLNMSQIKDLPLRIETFRRMTNLRFLKFWSYGRSSKIYLPEGIELCSEKLRYFHWDLFPLQSLPSTFCAEKLVELHMPGSRVTKLWDGLQDVVNLKKIELTGCRRLMELPDLSNASKLEWVHLDDCLNLRNIHSSLLQLETLAELSVNFCKKLTTLKSESHLKSLARLSFKDCSSLKEFSVSAEKIEELTFKGTAIDTVPSSIGRCGNLKWLDFYDPPKKVSSKISKSTTASFIMRDGREFDPSESHVIFDAFPSLEELVLFGCVKLFQLPDNISLLSSLSRLELNESNVESLPTSLKYLSCLIHLDVCDSRRLQSLPELPPSLVTLKARNCPILKTLIPSNALQYCDVQNCGKLDQQSLNGIMAAAHYRIKHAESTIVYSPEDRIPKWFSHRTTKSWIIIELPPRSDLLDFVFCFAVSGNIRPPACACYLVDSGIEKYVCNCDDRHTYELIADNVRLWNNHRIVDSLNAMERRAFGKVLFRISIPDDCIKGFGVCPVYASELELEIGNKSKRIVFELEADGQKQLPLTKKLKRFPPELELELNIESWPSQEIEIKGSDIENQDQQETILIDKKILTEFVFQPLLTESQMLNDNIEAFDFFKESELGDKFKRYRCESEGDEQQQPPLKKFRESTLQLVPLGLELELNTNPYTYLGIEGNQVGGSDHENQDEEGIQGT